MPLGWSPPLATGFHPPCRDQLIIFEFITVRGRGKLERRSDTAAAGEARREYLDYLFGLLVVLGRLIILTLPME
jgi:hypothetical protein